MKIHTIEPWKYFWKTLSYLEISKNPKVNILLLPAITWLFVLSFFFIIMKIDKTHEVWHVSEKQVYIFNADFRKRSYICVSVNLSVSHPPDQTKDNADLKFGTYIHTPVDHTHAPLEYNQKLFFLWQNAFWGCSTGVTTVTYVDLLCRFSENKV